MWRGTSLGLVALIVAAGVWLTRPPRHSHPGASPASSGGANGPVTFYDRGHVVGKLAYGMTKQQVVRTVGRPSTVIRWQGMPCWVYPLHEHSPAMGTSPAFTLDAVSACFIGGRYA